MLTLAQVANPRSGSNEAGIRSDPSTGVCFTSKTGDTIVQKAYERKVS